jgi:16S rRNA (cytosine967-C5)-methyltransferase
MDLTPTRLTFATEALATLLALDRPADAALRAWFRAHPKLGVRDRAVVAEVCFAVLRHLRRLEYLAHGRDPRRLVLAALLRVLGFNARPLEVMVSPETAGLAELKAAPEPDEAALRLSLPDWLYARLRDTLPPEELTALGRTLLAPAPMDLRVNTLRARRDDVLKTLHASGIDGAATPLSPIGIRLRDKPSLERHALFTGGHVEVQDEGSQLVALLVGPRRNHMVVDFCAGAGGKTLALGALMRSEGRLYAFDTSERRLSNLRPRLKRSGLSNVHPQRIDSERDPRVRRLAGKIDRVLVDAPCTGVGTLRRNPDLKWRMSPSSVLELTAKQRSILEAAAVLVKPGGRLVYATCSLLRDENEAIVETFLDTTPGWRLLDAPALLRAESIALDAEGPYLRLWPHVHGTDGFFAAALEYAP